MLAFVPAAISELLKRFPSTEGFLWLKRLCEFLVKKRHEHNLKTLHFLSLRYSANFGRSRLVCNHSYFLSCCEGSDYFPVSEISLSPKMEAAPINLTNELCSQ